MSTPAPNVLPSADVPISLPLDTDQKRPKVPRGMALLALSHTAIEHRLYEVMHAETLAANRNSGIFSIRRLLGLSGLRSHGSVLRGCAGLIKKQSIEGVAQDPLRRSSLYRVFSPDEIFARRRAVGMTPYPDEVCGYERSRAFGQIIQRVVERNDLSRREALVVLCCVEGLSNAEIGTRLKISEQTVKSHLRQIFDKVGVKRRTELVSRLLMQRSNGRRRNRKARAPISKLGSGLDV